jgi:hypothetical protein
MKLNCWKRALSSVLMLFVISLPAWAHKPPEKCEDDDSDEVKEHCQPVPEGGASYLYVILSGLTISGGILLRSKRSRRAVYPPEV